MGKHRIHGPAIFTNEGPAFYDAALVHNQPFATHQAPWQTSLSGEDETAFKAWVKAKSVPFDVEATRVDYDMRGFWLAVIKPGGKWEGGHFPDTWKTPYDTSFSNQSRYAKGGTPFKWYGEVLVDFRSGQVVFAEVGLAIPRGFVDDGRSTKLYVYTPPKGKQQRAKSQRGQLQRPDLTAYYNRSIQSIEPGDFAFRHVLVRPEEPPEERYKLLDPATTQSEWSDDGPLLTGSLTLQRPAPEDVASIPIKEGHRIRLQLFWVGRWRRMWDMRVPAIPSVDEKSGSMTVELSDDLTALHLNERQWDFKQDKQHPDGWTADEVTRFVCHEEHVPVGQLVQGTYHFKKLKLRGSGLEAIRKAWAIERHHTLVRFILKFRNGRFSVTPFERPGTLYIVKGVEKEATTQSNQPNSRPVTAIKAKGRIKHKKKEEKITELVQSKAATDRFGYSQKEKDYGRVKSRADLREQATRDLAKAVKITRTASLILPGVPFLEKGSCIQWRIWEPGWSGKVGDTDQDRSFVYVTSAQHSILPGSYETTVEVSQNDPYFADRQRRDKERREDAKKKREARKNKTGGKKGK